MRYPGEITPEEYDAHPGVRWSALAHMRKSPLHYKHALTAKRESSPPLRTGSALHTLVFEPEKYDERFVVYRESKTRGEGAKKNWIAFQEEMAAQSITILDPEEEARALGCAQAIATNACARQFIAPSRGRAEIPIVWTDERTGLVCKMRADWITIEELLLDLKSTRSGELRNFGRQAWHLGYFHQAHFYSMGLAHATGKKPDDIPFLFAAVESDEPHDVSMFEPCAETRYAAKEEVDKLMDLLVECQKRDKWPGRYEGVQMLSAPAYVLMSEDEEWEVTGKEVNRA